MRITGRGAAATVASVLFVVLAFLSVPALWVHNVMLDSQKFTDITVEATTDPTTAAALGDAAGTAFVTGLNLEQRLAAILPDRLTVIAGPVADGIQHGITTRTTNLLTSEGFASTWRTAIQGLYERFLAVMRGTAPNATLNGSTLTIDVKGAVMNGLLRLQQGGIIPADVTIDGDPSHPVVWNSALTLLFGPEPPDFGAVPVLEFAGTGFDLRACRPSRHPRVRPAGARARRPGHRVVGDVKADAADISHGRSARRNPRDRGRHRPPLDRPHHGSDRPSQRTGRRR